MHASSLVCAHLCLAAGLPPRGKQARGAMPFLHHSSDRRKGMLAILQINYGERRRIWRPRPARAVRGRPAFPRC